jgi:hypothetical protein
MDAKTADLVLCGITAMGAVTWLVALQFLIRSFPNVVPKEGVGQALEGEERPPTNWICGNAEVEGRPEQLAGKAVAALAKGNTAGIGPVKILERGDDHIMFQGVADHPSNRQCLARVGVVQLRFEPLGHDRTAVRFVAQVADRRWLLWLGVAFQALGLIALVALFCFLRTQVVADPNPAVRWQTLQMVQAVNFLWPPFLLAGLYRQGRRTLLGGFDRLIHNLPYLD